MKKILLAAVLMLVVVLALVACGGGSETTADGTTEETTTDVTVTTGAPGELAEGQNYIAVENDFTWEADKIDSTGYPYFGSGTNVLNELSFDYNNGYKKTYYAVAEDGTRTEYTRNEVKAMTMIGAKVTRKDDATETMEIEVKAFEVKVETEWKSVTARAGSYLMFDFTTNLPTTFYMTVTAKEGGSQTTAAYTQDNITVKGSNGKYTGVAKCTVPYSPGKTFYINICIDGAGYPIVATVPVEIKTAKYQSEYSLIFQGEWEQVLDPEYLPNLVDLFYNVYPRLYARFAFGTEPKTITFEADKEYDGVAYCMGTKVVVSVDYANSNPTDLGFFSHEITHSVQQYNQLNYDKDGQNGFTAWWTENMANYGGFRYFHWGYSTKFVQIYDVQTNKGLQDWGYQAYGDGSKLFLSYLDWKFPTTDVNKDGKITVDEYGVIDAINYTIKTATSKMYDTPNDPTTPFNKAVATATKGQFNCIEAIRQYYAKECQEGTWKFTGFRDYVDNFRTENLPGIPNPTYPMLEPVKPGDKTATALDTPITEGNNLALNATVIEFSGENSKNPVSYAFDGVIDKSSHWQAANGSAKDYKYQLMGYAHGFVIDLGEVKDFNTYTVVGRGAVTSTESQNMVEWEILISEDGKTWTSVDYQNYVDENGKNLNGPNVASYNIGNQKARYIELRIFTTDKGNTNTVRLVEFMLFDQE